MLKQKIIDPTSVPFLGTLRTLVLRHLGRLPERLDVFKLTTCSDFPGMAAMTPRYVIETNSHMTPPFAIGEDGVELEHTEDLGSVGHLDWEDAAKFLARELVEVA